MKIVVGLGNPGDKYRSTRHNVGFRAVDLLAERHGGVFEARGDLGEKAWTAKVDLRGHPVVLAKPRTFMNRSGSAVLALLRRHPIETTSELIVVFDDADLELGKVRVRPEGGHGGQNGMRSILEVIGTREFLRVKLLRSFDPEERPVVEGMIVAGADAVEALIEEGNP